MKKITIHVSQKSTEQVLEITIEDNGIGRIAASQLHIEDLKRKSFAVGASMRRLSLLNSERKDFVGVEIIDLYDIKGTAEGTRVVLKIDIR